MLKKVILITFLITTIQFKSKACVYPEHRDIKLLAILKLDSAHRVVLDRFAASLQIK